MLRARWTVVVFRRCLTRRRRGFLQQEYEVPPKRRDLLHFELGDADHRQWRRWIRQPNSRTMLRDHIAECIELFRQCSRLTYRRIIVLAGYIWLILVVIPIGAAHESETGTAVEHVEVDRISLAQHPVNFLRLLFGVGTVVMLAPVIKPSVPIFAVEDGLFRAKLQQLGNLILGISRAEVDGSMNVG